MRLRNWLIGLFVSDTPTPRYEIIDLGVEKMCAIKILDGEYAGIVYRYGSVSFSDDADTVSWVYEVDEGFDPGEDDKTFRQIQGDILMVLLERGLTNDDGVHLVG